jgi:excinuclease ABC subunit C
MLYQIQRCSAPCVGYVSEADYAEDVRSAVLFLQGKTTRCSRSCSRRWRRRARALEFERAARIRDKITRLNTLQSRQFVESATAGDIDVVAAAAERGLVAVNVVMVRGGRHVGDRTWFPRHADALALPEVVSAFLAQHYVERPVPPTIIAAGAEERGALAECCRRNRAEGHDRRQPGRRAPRVARDGRAERRVRDPAEARAEGDAGGRLDALQKALGCRRGAADRVLRRLAHDGRAGGRFVRDLRPARDAVVRIPALQRDAAAGGDDYAAMREALTRRCARIVAGEYPGARPARGRRGKGRWRRARLREQGLHTTQLIGIAKGPERKAGEEDIVFPDREGVLNLPADHPGCTCCSRSATRRTGSRSRVIARAGRRRGRRRRCRRSPASARRSGRRCSPTSAA